ncbi:MAG: hypothetical protein IRY94_16535 [Rhodospirillaceae bacterium]|nr:hypothetical protein [Rhodospirillaceae bacterium]
MRAWQFTRRRGRPSWEHKANTIDRGTPEARARRAALVGGADPALSEHPLGVLLARGLIGPETHAAACTYAWLYARAVGWPRTSCAPLYRRLAGEPAGPGPAPLDETAEAAIEERFRRGKNRLLAAGRRVCDATENVVVFGRFPRFLDSAGRRSAAARRADAMELAALRTGLEVLAACYGKAAARAGRLETHRPASLRPAVGVDRAQNRNVS